MDKHHKPYGDPDRMIEINKGLKEINKVLDIWDENFTGIKFLISDMNSLFDEIRIKNIKTSAELKKNFEKMTLLQSNLLTIKESKLWNEVEKKIA